MEHVYQLNVTEAGAADTRPPPCGCYAPKPAMNVSRSAARSPNLARLRDRALNTLAFGIAGRSAEVSALNAEGITLEPEGLRVIVPPVKGHPGRTVVVAPGLGVHF